MQVGHAADSTDIPSTRTGKERQFKTLLTGEDGALDNFRVYFVRQQGAVDVPRHKHNFDQVRMCLEGPGKQNYGEGRWIAPGEIAYFPEGTPYGPERSDTERLSLTLQFGGASRSGFISSARVKNAMEEMKEFGTFEKGIFKRVGQLAPGEKRNQDAYEAVWEHVNKRKLVYPKPRYGEAILMKPENFEWKPSEEAPGFARKQLGIFSERSLQFSMLKVDAGSRGLQKSRGGIQIGFVVQGSGAVNGEALRKHSAFSGREDFALTSDEGMELLLVGLPVFAEAEQQTLVAAE
ncbi:MAG: cupin domain-containing protein [Xanthobacteraceae bacterium]|nr:cupin domain-containing protein [Xanthobacteraceae bacterium]